MNRLMILVTAGLFLLVGAGCSSDDDPVVVGPPQIYTALTNFHNHLVADGTVDTQLSLNQGPGINLANHIVPGGVAVDRTLLLDAAQESSALNFFLTGGDGTILNQDEAFPLERDKNYIHIALGSLYVAQGQLRPTLMQLPALEAPPAGEVTFRFTHALAGSPAPIDIYVNGEKITNLVYGRASAPVVFSARTDSDDTLVIVPTGVTPDGSNEIWQSTGSLFKADRDYEVVLGHIPKFAFNGDINGRAAVYLNESQ